MCLNQMNVVFKVADTLRPELHLRVDIFDISLASEECLLPSISQELLAES